MHPRYQQAALRAFCSQHGIAVVAYASLGCGRLLAHDTVLALARKLGRPAAQAWVLPICMHACTPAVRLLAHGLAAACLCRGFPSGCRWAACADSGSGSRTH